MGDNSGWGLTDEVTSDTDGAREQPEQPETSDDVAANGGSTDTESTDAVPDEEVEEVDEETLEDELRAAIEDGDVTGVTTSDIMDRYKEIEDADLIMQALEMDERKSALKYYRRQLRNLDYDVKEDVGSPESDISVEEGVNRQADFDEVADAEQESDDAEQDDSADDEVEEEVVDDAEKESERDREQDEEAEEYYEENADDIAAEAKPGAGEAPAGPSSPETDESQAEQPAQTADADGGVESIGAEAEASAGPQQAADESSAETVQADNASAPTPAPALSSESSDGVTAIDASDIAPDALSASEAARKERRHKIMAFGPPGTWKTHFGFTMPEPVVIIDTEQKSSDIAHKFSDKVFHIFQPSNYLEAAGGTDRRGVYQEGALEKALKLLERYQSEQGVRGTLVVDSMSKMWEWSQLHYIDKWHPEDDRTLDEIREDFTSGLSSAGPGSWGRIKRYHNAQFRQPMVDSPFHLYWTAKQKKDYEPVFEDGDDGADLPLIPDGEKDNIHEVDSIIHALIKDGVRVGYQRKAGITDHGYHGLPYPTFPKHEKLTNKLSQWEADNDVPDVVDMDDHEVKIVRGVSIIE